MTTAKKSETTTEAELTESEKLVTFVPSVSFTGWPDGHSAETRNGVHFKAGIESVAVPQSFADLMRRKGLVADNKTTTADAGK